jgi:hypothetical protein
MTYWQLANLSAAVEPWDTRSQLTIPRMVLSKWRRNTPEDREGSWKFFIARPLLPG